MLNPTRKERPMSTLTHFRRQLHGNALAALAGAAEQRSHVYAADYTTRFRPATGAARG